jgi:hypothetical protein
MFAVKDPRKIEKVTLTHADDVAAEMRGDVIARANKEFNYVGDSFGAAGPLAKTLVECGIKVLKTDDVRAYMVSKTSLVEFDPIRRERGLMCLLGLSVVVAVNVGVKMSEAPTDYSPEVAAIVSAIALVVVFFISYMMADFRKLDQRWGDKHAKVSIETKWVQYSFGAKGGGRAASYRGYIPVHILNEALSVRSKLTSAEFSIYELTREEREVPRPLPDPFMEVSLGAERYFIAVWDEREFEAKM